jgi:hypothetical protein
MVTLRDETETLCIVWIGPNTYVPTFRSSCLLPSFLDFFGAEDERSMRLRNVAEYVPINIAYYKFFFQFKFILHSFDP